MTLLIYKDGILAADTGCTRNESREVAHKIYAASNSNHKYIIAYAGEMCAIAAHFRELKRRIDNGIDCETEYPPMNCEGIVIRRNERTGEFNVFSFNCFAESTGRGVWCTETANAVFVGWGSAVTSAIAINHVCPHYSAAQIIKYVSDVNSACDIIAGVDWIDVTTDKQGNDYGN